VKPSPLRHPLPFIYVLVRRLGRQIQTLTPSLLRASVLLRAILSLKNIACDEREDTSVFLHFFLLPFCSLLPQYLSHFFPACLQQRQPQHRMPECQSVSVPICRHTPKTLKTTVSRFITTSCSVRGAHPLSQPQKISHVVVRCPHHRRRQRSSQIRPPCCPRRRCPTSWAMRIWQPVMDSVVPDLLLLEQEAAILEVGNTPACV